MKHIKATLLPIVFQIFLHTLVAASDGPAHGIDEDGFFYPIPGGQLEFPRDHGSHPHYKSEWWYITGHLTTDKPENRYGFQITFFRAATNIDTPEDHIYMAHAAITDLETGQFLHEERINQSGWNADAAVGHLDVFNGNWSLKMKDSTSETIDVRFSILSKAILNLTLQPEKPLTLFGDNGYSRKGKSESAASYYATFTRLAVEGTIETDGNPKSARGVAWMDHEFSSSQLDEAQIGWNWTSLHLDDGTDLMAYIMRRSDNEMDPNSSLTLIANDGTKTRIQSSAFSWTPIRYWQSPHTGARYPIEYTVQWTLNGETNSVTVKTKVDDQELQGSVGQFQYWEGAGTAYDPNGIAIGSGYTELTGYTESLQGKF